MGQTFVCATCGTHAPIAFASDSMEGSCRWCGGEEPWGGIEPSAQQRAWSTSYPALSGALTFYARFLMERLAVIAEAAAQDRDNVAAYDLGLRAATSLEVALGVFAAVAKSEPSDAERDEWRECRTQVLNALARFEESRR